MVGACALFVLACLIPSGPKSNFSWTALSGSKTQSLVSARSQEYTGHRGVIQMGVLNGKSNNEGVSISFCTIYWFVA